MKLVFRMDDVYLLRNHFEEEIFNLFAKHEIPLNVGIIPFDKNEKPYVNDNVNLNSFIVPCLHGYTHDKSGLQGEFDGIKFTIQKEWIQKGMVHLSKILDQKVACFIPPFNKYDENTVKVISEMPGISLSGGIDKKYNNDLEIPVSLEHFNLLENIGFRKFLKFLPKECKLIILFHPYNFSEVTTSHFKTKRRVYSLHKLDNLLTQLRKDGHKFLKLSDISITTMKYHVLSNLIKKLFKERVNFWF